MELWNKFSILDKKKEVQNQSLIKHIFNFSINSLCIINSLLDLLNVSLRK